MTYPIRIPLAILLLSSSTLPAQTLIFGDRYNANGDGTIVGAGNSSPSNLVETATHYDVSTGNIVNNPSGYNAYLVGNQYGGNPDLRLVQTFDLSGYIVPGQVEICSLTLFMEVSGTRPAATVNYYAGSIPTGPLGTPIGTQSYSPSTTPSGGFVPITLDPTALDLNTMSSFTITHDAPISPEYNTFGSGLAPNPGMGGTTFVEVSPYLQIELKQVPEPAGSLLCSLLAGIFLLRRRRK